MGMAERKKQYHKTPKNPEAPAYQAPQKIGSEGNTSFQGGREKKPKALV